MQRLTAALLLLSAAGNADGQRSEKGMLTARTDSLIPLDEIVVKAHHISGKLKSSAGSLSVATVNDLMESEGTTLAPVLNSLPGVSMQSGTYSTSRIVIRGMGSRTPYNSNRIRAYLNEIPLTTSDGISAPEEIDILSLGRIEIVKGPSSAIWGAGLGGTISMYTRKTEANGLGADIRYGSFNTLKSSVSGSLKWNKSDIGAFLNRLQSDGYRENNRFGRTTIIASANTAGTDWRINTLLLMISTEGEIPSSIDSATFAGNPKAAAPSWKAIEGFERSSRGIAGITIGYDFSPSVNNNLILFGRLNDSFEKRPFNDLDDRSVSAGFRNSLNIKIRNMEAVIGAEWITERYEWSLLLNQVLVNRNRERRSSINLFGISSCKPADKLTLSLAGALNHVSYSLDDLFPSNGDRSASRNFPLIFSPRAGINYMPVEKVALYASSGHGFSMPSPEETLLPEGDVNPEIKPETGFQHETGFRLVLFRGRTEIDASAYMINLKNLLVTKRVSEDIFTGINAGRTRHTGFEAMVRQRILQKGSFPGSLQAVINFTWSVNRFIDFEDDGITYDGNNLPGIPGSVIQARIHWNPFKHTMLDANIYYSGSQFLNDSNSDVYHGYLICGMRLQKDFFTAKAGRISIFSGINNLTNSRYASMLSVNARVTGASAPRYYYPGMPLSINAGIRYIPAGESRQFTDR